MISIVKKYFVVFIFSVFGFNAYAQPEMFVIQLDGEKLVNCSVFAGIKPSSCTSSMVVPVEMKNLTLHRWLYRW